MFVEAEVGELSPDVTGFTSKSQQKKPKIRILALVNDKSGSHYHRIRLPLTFLEKEYHHDLTVTFSNKFDETLLKNGDYNLLYYNKICNVSPGTLGIWRQKYGIQIVVDIDDTWTLESSHFMYKYYEAKKIPHLIKSHIQTADLVFCTTENLKKDIELLNSNVLVCENAIPYGYQQFHDYKNCTEDLKFMWSGSISHYTDFEILRNPFKRISSDKQLMDESKFVMAGYDDSSPQSKSIWDKMENIFTANGSIKNYLRINSNPVEKYIEAYENADVCIIPLVNNKFNSYKSNLKILEASVKKLPVICSDTIPYSSFPNDLVMKIKNQSDWYIYMKYCINNPNHVFDIGEKLFEYCEKNYNLIEINKKRFSLLERIIDDYSYYDSLRTIQSNCIIYSLTYDKSQIVDGINVMNGISTIKDKSYLFEYNPMIWILSKAYLEVKQNLDKINPANNYIGIFSWRFPQKTGYSKRMIEAEVDGNYDIYNFSPTIFKNGKDYFDSSERYHPGLTNILKYLCSKLSLKYTDNPRHVVYSNFFVAKYDLYKQYFDKVIGPCITIMETDPVLKEMVWKDANYKKLSKDELKQRTGLDYYTFHTFALERMFSIWLENNIGNFKLKQVN